MPDDSAARLFPRDHALHKRLAAEGALRRAAEHNNGLGQCHKKAGRLRGDARSTSARPKADYREALYKLRRDRPTRAGPTSADRVLPMPLRAAGRRRWAPGGALAAASARLARRAAASAAAPDGGGAVPSGPVPWRRAGGEGRHQPRTVRRLVSRGATSRCALAAHVQPSCRSLPRSRSSVRHRGDTHRSPAAENRA